MTCKLQLHSANFAVGDIGLIFLPASVVRSDLGRTHLASSSSRSRGIEDLRSREYMSMSWSQGVGSDKDIEFSVTGSTCPET